jgi:hypothetical protein
MNASTFTHGGFSLVAQRFQESFPEAKTPLVLFVNQRSPFREAVDYLFGLTAFQLGVICLVVFIGLELYYHFDDDYRARCEQLMTWYSRTQQDTRIIKDKLTDEFLWQLFNSGTYMTVLDLVGSVGAKFFFSIATLQFGVYYYSLHAPSNVDALSIALNLITLHQI